MFQLDYPDSEGGDENGYKIGIGYQSDYNKRKRSVKGIPVKISPEQFDALTEPNLTNTEFQCLLNNLTKSYLQL